MKKSEIWLLIFLVVIFISVRSVHFAEHLNFSTDQATFSSAALDIFRDKKFTLIGPSFTLQYDGRFMFQGPLIYYMTLFFLLLGGFDPVVSSFWFMIFCALMIFPLFLGVKTLINKNAAILAVIIYTLFPVSINYTGFLWNPNYQYALLPLLIFGMGRFKKKPTSINFFLLSLLSGILLEFHYMFILVILGLGVFYFRIKKIPKSYFGLYLLGIILGNLPIILFDLRHNFYNISTLLFVSEHFQAVIDSRSHSGIFYPHYFLSSGTFIILIALWYFQKLINPKALLSVFMILFLWSLFLFFPYPKNVYGMPAGWNYLDEQRVHNIIIAQNLTNFNVSNLLYDSKAEVQKYLLKKDNLKINPEDYKNNDYLFVITDKQTFLTDPAGEIMSVLPAQVVNKWPITPQVSLYLVERNK